MDHDVDDTIPRTKVAHKVGNPRQVVAGTGMVSDLVVTMLDCINKLPENTGLVTELIQMDNDRGPLRNVGDTDELHRGAGNRFPWRTEIGIQSFQRPESTKLTHCTGIFPKFCYGCYGSVNDAVQIGPKFLAAASVDRVAKSAFPVL